MTFFKIDEVHGIWRSPSGKLYANGQVCYLNEIQWILTTFVNERDRINQPPPGINR
jgi:hypothetical protein